ncbi:MAG TPA: phosphohydrolase [Bacteroidetes bacterium]|nr:phosphohydrolase [Bacteroidota bacterium]
MLVHIEKTITYVKKQLANAEGGHDWWHIERVWKSAKKIAETENVNLLVVELGALLHDIADAKFHDGDEELGPQIAAAFMREINVDQETILHVVQIIKHISFKGGKEAQTFTSLELNVVQDADRLDAIGAIGIARTFNYGGFKNREIFNPNVTPNLLMTKEEYKKSDAPSINHFYEKLLLLKDLMNTETGKQMAIQRHQFMELYLAQFYQEWNGEM